jgi:hypothetical protein
MNDFEEQKNCDSQKNSFYFARRIEIKKEPKNK